MKSARAAVLEAAFVIGIAGAAVAGYRLTSGRTAAPEAITTGMRRAQMRIEAMAEERLPSSCRPLDVERSEPTRGVTPVAVMRSSAGSVLLLDGPSGHLYRFSPGRGTSGPAEALPGLSAASGAVQRLGRTYVALGTTIRSFSTQKAQLSTVVTDFAISDFAVLDSGGFVVSASVRGNGQAAWVYWLRPSGLLRAKLGLHTAYGLTAVARDFSKLSFVATDGRATVLSAGAYAPAFWIFSLKDHRATAVNLPLPGEAEVAALAKRADLVTVGHGEFALPSFAVGAAWAAPYYEVLVDAPSPLLFRITSAGKVAGCRVWRHLDQGIQLHGLFPAGQGRFYTVGMALDGSVRLYRLGLAGSGPP